MQLPASPRPATSCVVEQPADRHAGDAELAEGTEVGEHEDAERAAHVEHTRRRADAGLVFHRDHPGAGADDAFGDWPTCRCVDGSTAVADRHVAAPGVVEPGVVALADDGTDHVVDADGGHGLEHGVDHGVEDLPTDGVPVSMIGVSRKPSSPMEIAPVSSPTPLSTATPAAGGWWNTSVTGAGRIAVTPVRATGSSDQHVTWPTSTPGTSVIALCGPVGGSPNVSPRSRARALGAGGPIRRMVGDGDDRDAGGVDGAPSRARAEGGYWLGVRLSGDEEPDAVTSSPSGYGRPAQPRRAGEHGLEPVLAVHDAAFVDFLARAWPAWVAEGHLEDPGQPQVVPYLFATAGFAARLDPRRRPATIRAEAALYAMDTMTLISEGTFAAACAAADCAVTAADLVLAGDPAA